MLIFIIGIERGAATGELVLEVSLHIFLFGQVRPDPVGIAVKQPVIKGARIICVADSFDAMTSTRAYRGSLPEEIALKELEDNKGLLSDVLFRRAHHVVTENQRVLQGVEALREGKIHKFGISLYESHYSLKKNYEVSCRELDILVDLASKEKGTIGARMTGAGFGGCTVNLVETGEIANFIESVGDGYKKKTGISPAIYACQPSGGVSFERL